ncbi:hypothetical protein HPB52_006059 [Rhipicephalus sanguineus]|uniref:Uncharacterized protein n=1 Tax=Rhipicephalus sanguineus TaxID=34632 RepID=A0A9D4T2Q6_RHISA|nr:hypothetical protein HPB52_006059 [Rhipicephalus sanguineus]
MRVAKPKLLLQEFLGGTTYFYQHEEAGNTTEEGQAVLLPEYQMYPGNPAHIEFMKPKANAPSFFLPDELRMTCQQKWTTIITFARWNQVPRTGRPSPALLDM